MGKYDAIDIRFTASKRGVTLYADKRRYSLIYPGQIWKTYPAGVKEVLVDNLAHLLTIDMPFVSPVKRINYNTSLPVFKPFFYNVVMSSIPPSLEVSQEPTEYYIKKFFNAEYSFKDTNIKYPPYNHYDYRERSVVPLSLGKDSLLTLALASEMGLDPVAVYINDTVSPKENKIKLKFLKDIAERFDLTGCVITNEVEKINDFETWGTEATCLGYNHMMTGFCMISLPVAHYYRAKYIVVGNQQDMNFTFENKNGYKTTASPDQYYEWTRHQNSVINMMTNGAAGVMSFIEPLTDIAITGILHTRYRDLSRYLVSCDSLDAFPGDRWCQACSKCARTSLYIKSFGIDTSEVGFTKSLLSGYDARFYRLFDGREVDLHEEGKDARDQQLLAFYMLYERGGKGYLVDLFKRKFLKEAKRRKNDLKRRFFGMHDRDVVHPLKSRVNRILSEALREVKNER
ncbi:MAG: hypothetical protein AUJ75_02290 [Candidatus Omnitrophica bacterium CG1_02_49_10]|nr:MAG: hypothetical protein AUJ75_02290 [Candidatus Omnitrophica bacterium CG1_02_49_10]